MNILKLRTFDLNVCFTQRQAKISKGLSIKYILYLWQFWPLNQIKFRILDTAAYVHCVNINTEQHYNKAQEDTHSDHLVDKYSEARNSSFGFKHPSLCVHYTLILHYGFQWNSTCILWSYVRVAVERIQSGQLGFFFMCVFQFPLLQKSYSVCSSLKHSGHLHTHKYFSSCPYCKKANILTQPFPWIMKMNAPPLFPFACSCAHIQITAT